MSEFGELSRAALGVIVQPAAAVNDDEPRTGEIIAVPDEEAGQLGIPVAVVDGFFFPASFVLLD